MLEGMQAQCYMSGPVNGFEDIRRVMDEAVREEKVEPLWLEDMTLGSDAVESIHRGIEEADFLIADLTGSNPNVMYEVGFARGLKKPIIPILQEREGRAPFVMAGTLYYPYDPGSPDRLRDALRRAVRNFLQRRAKQGVS